MRALVVVLLCCGACTGTLEERGGGPTLVPQDGGGRGRDAGLAPGMDAGRGGADAGPGGVDAGPGGYDAGPGALDAGRDAGGGGPGPTGGRGTCGTGGGTTTTSFERVDLDGSFYLRAATAPDPSRPVPLLVALHGDEGTTDTVAFVWGNVWSARRDFVLALPQVPGGGGSWWRSDAARSAAFIRAVVDDVARSYNIDVHRIYAAGLSGGSTFLGWSAFGMQDVFAAMELDCGGSGARYSPPPDPACAIAGRFTIAADDFLRSGARSLHDEMQSRGHDVAWNDPACSGHCCFVTDPTHATGAYTWLLSHAKCGATESSGCGSVTDLR